VFQRVETTVLAGVTVVEGGRGVMGGLLKDMTKAANLVLQGGGMAG